MTSAKFFQEPSDGEMVAYQKRATGSTNWWLAVKGTFYLVLCVTIVGGGGFLLYNAAQKANQSEYSGTGAGPAMQMTNFFMHLVYLDWDKRIEEYQGHVAETTWPEEPEPSPVDLWSVRRKMEELEWETRPSRRAGASPRRPDVATERGD